MKEISVKLYNFNELSKEVRQSIINEVRWKVMDNAMTGASIERQKSLETFCDIFCVELDRYECDYNGYSFKFHLNEDNIRDLFWYLDSDDITGKYLRRFLNCDEVWNNIIKGRYHGKFTKDKRLIQRYSKVVFERDCALTGVCYDDDLMNFVWEVYDKPIPDNFSLHDLVSMCLTRFFESWFKEYTYWGDTDSAIEEELENYYSDTYFFANGKKYEGEVA